MIIRTPWPLNTLAIVAFVLAATSSAQAAMVTLQEPPYSDVSEVVSQTAPGNVIAGGGSGDVSSYLFSDESITFSPLKIVYEIHGSGSGASYSGGANGFATECGPPGPGCSLWGPEDHEVSFLFSDLDFGDPATILTAVVLTTHNVFGANVPIASITPNSFLLNFGQAGILNSSIEGYPALGTITMDLTVGTVPVPLPASFPLLLAACVGFGLLLRRSACADANS